MPDAVDDGAEPAAETGKKKPPLMLLVGGGVGAVVLLGGVAAGAMMMGGHKDEVAAHAPAKKAKHHEAKKGEGGKAGADPVSEGPDGVLYYTMPDLTANIQGQEGRNTYLKLKLVFEVPDQETADAIAPNAPRLNDMFQTFMRELRPEDLNGSAGSYQLRMEIQRRVNLVIAPAKVNAVLIQEMLVN